MTFIYDDKLCNRVMFSTMRNLKSTLIEYAFHFKFAHKVEEARKVGGHIFSETCALNV